MKPNPAHRRVPVRHMDTSLSHLQHVVVAVLMVLHIKLVDDDGDAAASGCADVPHTLGVLGVSAGVTGAAEGAAGPRQIPTTTCRGPHLVSMDIII